jgi:hypothetical protein
MAARCRPHYLSEARGMSLFERFERRLGLPVPDLCTLVIALSRIPYGRNREARAEAVVDEWRGTCSTKHLLLRDLVAERWPTQQLELWHRPYLVTRELAGDAWGQDVATAVPEAGLIDVHTFATVEVSGRRVFLDVTASLPGWDGLSDIPLQCGPGSDILATGEPLRIKKAIVETYCDPTVREPFIAALTERDRTKGEMLRPKNAAPTLGAASVDAKAPPE